MSIVILTRQKGQDANRYHTPTDQTTDQRRESLFFATTTRFGWAIKTIKTDIQMEINGYQVIQLAFRLYTLVCIWGQKYLFMCPN